MHEIRFSGKLNHTNAILLANLCYGLLKRIHNRDIDDFSTIGNYEDEMDLEIENTM